MSKAAPSAPAILLVGPFHGARQSSDTNVIGGNKMMVADSARELGARGFRLDIVDTSGSVVNLSALRFHAHRLVRFLRMMWQVMRRIRSARLVFLIIAPYSAIMVASALWVLCRIAGRPLALRLSGSAPNRVYRNYNAALRWLADHTYLRSELVYVETRGACQDFQPRSNVRWFPNTRDMAPPARLRPGTPRRLIFMSRLDMRKGLAESLAACRDLPEGCSLRVFGPPLPNMDFSLFRDHPRASYEGIVEPEDLPRVLSEHHLMLFPTYWPTEGYPGVIIEAFQCGLPVITTEVGGIPEMVEHEVNALLVEPRSSESLRAAIKRLLDDPDLYRRLCRGAERRGDYFRSANWYDAMSSELHRLCSKGALPEAGDR